VDKAAVGNNTVGKSVVDGPLRRWESVRDQSQG